MTPPRRFPPPRPVLTPLAVTVPVPAGLLHALLTIATFDGRTAVLTYPAWRAQALAGLVAATDPEHSTMSVALLVLDVDAFHDLNTTWGHPAADQVLTQIAHVLRRLIGAGVVVGRYGGDEFVVFLAGAGVDHACGIAEQIRAQVAALRILVRGPHDEPTGVATVTVSIGVAAHSTPADPDAVLTGLFWAADAALYAAKAAGGNHVRTAPTRPLRSPRLVEGLAPARGGVDSA